MRIVMNFRRLYDFLRDLNTEGNNNKEWMDAHRDYYQQVREEFIAFLQEVNDALVEIDTNYQHTSVRDSIMRINNNRMFHPDKPIYKDHFAALLDVNPKTADFFFTLGLRESFLATGLHRPEKEVLGSIREEIDYSAEEFQDIVNDEKFKAVFEGFMDDNKLKNPPKGYTADHPMVEYLKHRSFVVKRDLTQKQVINTDFKQVIIETYEAARPFREFLNRSIEGIPMDRS